MIKLHNGYKIPQLGLGTFLMTDQNEVEKVVLEALEVGYRHFDTAQMYYNEKAIGNALSRSNLNRNEYYLTTKLMHHHSKEETMRLIDESLNNLKTDYLDLLLIHWPNHDPKVNINTWKVFEEYYHLGKVKAIGVSNFTRYQLDELLKDAKIIPHINQVEHHPNLSQIPLIEYMNNKGIKMTGYGPLMRGHLYDDYIREIIEPIAIKHNASIAQIAIAWGLSKNIMMIPKTVNKVRLIENFNSKFIKLDEDDIFKIDAINVGKRYYSDPSNNVYGKFIK